jgi:hypothetical protein
MEYKYIHLYKKYNNKLFKGGRPFYYNKNINAGYSKDGSYSTYNDTDYDYFNKIMSMYCGEECTPKAESLTEVSEMDSKNWGLRPEIERKIKSIDDNNKKWLVDHWIYADNFYKVNLIIILFDDLYSKNKSDDIVESALEFLLYNSCSGLIQGENQLVGKNFNNIARKLRENPMIKEYLEKIKYATNNSADNLCESVNYRGTEFRDKYNGGLYDKYNNNQKISKDHHILYNYYSKRYH